MIVNNSKIEKEGKVLHIDLSIKDTEHVSGQVLLSVEVCLLKNGEKEILKTIEIPEVSEFIKDYRIEEFELYKADSFSNDLIFILPYCDEGTITPPVNCGEDNTSETFAIYDKCKMYNESINYAASLHNGIECNLTDNSLSSFSDFLLKWKALDLAIETKQWLKANKYFYKFFSMNFDTNSKKCSCNGKKSS